MSLIERRRDEVLLTYGSAIGRSTAELTTPALILDIVRATANIGRMASALAGGPVALRPHVKTHKSPDLAKLQADAGVIGFSTATVWEAMVLAEAGLDDLFVVNTVVDGPRIRHLAELARDRRVIVAVDDVAVLAALGTAAVAAGSRLGVAVEVNTGMNRAGVDEPGAARTIARRISETAGLQLEGVTGYEGHCSNEPDVARRAVLQQAAMRTLLEANAMIRDDGLACPIVSAGGTRTWWMAAATPGLTEIQAGTYVLMDRFHTGIEGGFEYALRVATTVVSRPKGRLVVDAGTKSVADAELAAIIGWPELSVRSFDEEHGIFARPADGPQLGTIVELLPGYAPSTINLYDAYHVVDNDRVVDIWPIVPRGPGHHGLAHPASRP
jgi:D-serine deaminase-like pyridoxal phosphate-dependent protein